MARQYQPFKFRQFSIAHNKSIFKVGTDGVLVGAWANINDAQTILDIGTGSGLIAIMCAQRNVNAQITGIEIDKNSAQQAQENAQNCPWSNRLQIIQSSIQTFTSATKFNHIISNPPYFISGTQSSNQYKAQTRHTNLLSFNDLIKSTKKHLLPDGKASFILPTEEAKVFEKMCFENQLYLNRFCQVRPLKNKNVERLLMEFSFTKSTIQKTELIIQHPGRNNYTEDYKKLTGAFYLAM